MQTTRRGFLAGASTIGLGTAALPATLARTAREDAAQPGRLLVLGGTRFLGPQIVNSALAAGWEVTLFNRGRSNPEMFPDVEKRRGDRNTGDLSALGEGTWDVAIDTSGYIPEHVSAACELLAERVGHYVFVSTISVYADSDAGIVDEGGALAEMDPALRPEFQVIQDVGKYGSQYYGALKALCEQAAEAAMPGRVTNVRPGLIVGPADPTDRFTYWPVRVHQGGEVLAPGDGSAGVQVIDVRDLGAWCFEAGRNEVAGVFNAVGFDGTITFEELLHGCKLVSGADASFTWVPGDFLLEQDVGPWMELPLWIPGAQPRYANARALAAGLRFRPLADTIRATLEWHLEERGEDYAWKGAGLAPEKERNVLAAWHGREES